MDYIGKIVIHKSYGKGLVTLIDDGFISVSFDIGLKKFNFPDVFKTFLTAEDPIVGSEIDKAIKGAEEEKAIKSKEEVEERERLRWLEREKNKPKPRLSKTSSKVNQKANIAFKCNYCDGGKSDTQVGYDGVCSDKIIHNNILVEKRTWCSSKDSACFKYQNGEITREELVDLGAGAGFVCYESRMLRDWKALAGGNLYSETQMKARKIKNVQSNSLCILTTRDPKHSEDLRFIFAVFLIDETYEGDGRDEGYVTTESEFKIKLSPVEARSLRFWNYYKNEGNRGLISWSSGLYRYINDEQAARILKDIAKVKQNTDDEDLAAKFLAHFCTMNKIDETLLT